MAIIPWWCIDIVDIVCMFENELPMIFMDLQVHLLIHLHDDFEIFGVLSCR